MASAFTHAVAASAIASFNFKNKAEPKFWLLSVFCSVIPDADALGFWMGVPYHSIWGHRGISHSFFFAFLLSALVLRYFYSGEKAFSRGWWSLYSTFFWATASHPILDAFTNGGLGVAFFAPVSNVRYFFPWRVIAVSPISITRFFSITGLEVLKSEFFWVWIPSIICILVATVFSRERK